MAIQDDQKKNATLNLSIAENQTSAIEFPVLEASLGPQVLDISALSKANVFTFDPGFTSTAACKSKITYIDGNEGILLHRGYPIDQLAQNASFLEVAYLLLYGEKANTDQQADFEEKVLKARTVPHELSHLLAGFPVTAHPMAILCSLTSALAGYYYGNYKLTDPQDRLEMAISFIAKVPTLAAMAYRHTQKLSPLLPKSEFNYIENFFYMLFGEENTPYQPNPTLVRALDRIFILHADHEQNASTSTVRLAGSTGTDPFVAISAGMAALWGPAHGGANEAALKMLQQIGDISQIEHYLARAKDPKDSFRLMGFGHRVYKNYDPRAKVMREACHDVLQTTNSKNLPLFQLAMELERIALEDEYFIQRKLYPNVDFYSGITLSAMGIPSSMFTPIFATARTSGWLAHFHEMWYDLPMKIGRPRQLYIGSPRRNYEKKATK